MTTDFTVKFYKIIDENNDVLYIFYTNQKTPTGPFNHFIKSFAIPTPHTLRAEFIETFHADNRRQLLARKGHHIKTYNPSHNITMPATPKLPFDKLIKKMCRLREAADSQPADSVNPHVKQAIQALETMQTA